MGRGREQVSTYAFKLVVGATLALAGLAPAMVPTPAASANTVFEGPVPRANCAGNDPFYLEPALQGEVPLKDRQDGRSQLGYRCNLELVGQHQGQGAGWQNAWYDHCDYFDQMATPGGTGAGLANPGVQVIDASDPAHPKLTANLETQAMDGPWESLKVNAKRGLLAGVGGLGGDLAGPLDFSIYDVSQDCAHPKLLADLPLDVPYGHEGNWAPDGLTYYGSSSLNGTYAAIDVTNPSSPTIASVFHNPAGVSDGGHGLSISDDGKTAYLVSPACGNGLEIADVSQVQARAPAAQVSHVGSVCWTDGSTAQHTIPVSYGGRPYVVFVDEGGGSDAGSGISGAPAGAARIIDIANPAQPQVISKLRLEIQTSAHGAANQADIAGDGGFGYEGHYCAVDQQHDPTALACGYFQSGIRVFDIRDPHHPAEIAYYNPPAQVQKWAAGQLPGSEHGFPADRQPPNGTADWCTSQIRFYHAPDGTWQLWAQCQDNGFMALRFTNRAYPLAPVSSMTTTFSAPAPAVNSASGTNTPNTSSGTPSPAIPMAIAVLGLSSLVLRRRFSPRDRG